MRSTIRLITPLLLLPTLAAPVFAATAAPVSPNCGGSTTPIADIQGPGAPSPLAGQNVSIEAVVTADFGGTDGFGGFFVQQADAQRRNQPGVSEGLFVYAPKVRAKAGDLVHVTGKVEEYGQTQLTQSGAIAVCANNQTVTPVTLTLPVDSPNAFAAYEGMRVRLPQTLNVTDNYGRPLRQRDAQQRPPAHADERRAARAGADADRGERTQPPDPRRRLEQAEPATVPYPAPGLSAANTLRAGYTVRDVDGVLEVRYGAWRVQPLPGAAVPAFEARTNPRTNAPARDPKSNLRVASFNVLNYFNGNGLGGGFDDPNNRGAKNFQEFQRQEAKIVSALKAIDADVIGLMEIQNNGYGELSAVRQLAAKLGNQWRVVDPGVSRLGGDAITVAMIYDSRKVEPVGRAATLAIDDKNRQPLAQSFRLINGNKQSLTVAVNHLKSKNCPDAANDDLDRGDGRAAGTRRARARRRRWPTGSPATRRASQAGRAADRRLQQLRTKTRSARSNRAATATSSRAGSARTRTATCTTAKPATSITRSRRCRSRRT